MVIPRSEEWPGVFDENGDAVLAGIAVNELGQGQCNAPYIVNDTTVGYCDILARRDKPHKGDHAVHFTRPTDPEPVPASKGWRFWRE